MENLRRNPESQWKLILTLLHVLARQNQGLARPIGAVNSYDQSQFAQVSHSVQKLVKNIVCSL